MSAEHHHDDHLAGHHHDHDQNRRDQGQSGHRHRRGRPDARAGVFRLHSHDSVDRVDDALATSAAGMTALKVSVAGLALTALIQLAIVVLSGSVALLSDTVHNFADAFTALPLAMAFWLGRRPANRRYTYGYGRAEDLAGIFVVLTVAASAIFAGYVAISRLIHPATVTHLPWVAVAGFVGFIGNELVARYRIAAGRRIGSAALEADGYHARTDGFSSLGVLAGAIGVAAGWASADPIFGLIITISILVVVRNAARDIYRRLMDAVDPALVAQVEAVLAGTDGVQSVDAIRLRWVGHNLHAEADIVSDATLPLGVAHDIAEEARHRLLHQVRRLTSVTVHSNPCGHDGRDPHALTAHHRDSNPLRSPTALVDIQPAHVH